MDREPHDDVARTLREQAARYVVGAKGQPIAVLLTLEEYDHYLDLLDDEANSQDHELAARPAGEERLSFRDYLHQRRTSRGDVQS